MQSDDAQDHNRSPGPSNEGSALRLLQITDSHLYADPAKCLVGVNTQQSFTQVLELAVQRFSQPDLILATGDLVHDASEAGYKRASRQFQHTGITTYCLAGNHDDPAVMTAQMNAPGVTTPKSDRLKQWLLVLLDSSQPGDPGGHLADSELDLLERKLTDHPDHHTLVCLHHHPVAVGSQWIDRMSLDNSAPFFAILDRHPNVRGVLWGHVHQTFDSERNGVRLMGTPSTCIQFTKGQDAFGIEALAPGYRWLELMPEGEINTGVERLESLPEGLDITSPGY